MMSYKFARRSFLSAIGGASCLEILLQNMEAAAQGAGAPPRFLMMHWPVGTMKYAYIPSGSGTGFTCSSTFGQPGYIIAPFATPELKPYFIGMHGFTMNGISGRGGCHEDGTPFATTGSSSPGTRQNGGETDDGTAGGPSWDQIMLENCPALQKKDSMGNRLRSYYNSICDQRIDSYETSTRCLSYGYATRSVTSAVPGGSIMEHTPLIPTLSPLTAFNDLFTGFMPGGGGMTDTTALRMLKHRKSVLDHSLRELDRLKLLAPANERVKIDSHAAAVRQIENQLADDIARGGMGMGGGKCGVPTAPPSSLSGSKGDVNSDYGNPVGRQDDSPNHEAVGNAHAGIIRAAFACDIIRVATFQWSPGTNHVSWKGADPERPTEIYMHHPLSHKNGSKAFFDGQQPGTGDAARYIWNAMVNINRWYFDKIAAVLNTFRTTADPLATDGGNLLDRTVIPMITEVADASHNHNGHPAIIFGGTKLGMQGGRFQTVSGNHNQVWLTAAQAFLGANPANAIPTTNNPFYRNGVNPISGMWVAPT
jgi:hypothetical protein